MKILFLINGLGLGNSTRCHAVIQRLHAKGAEVEVATSGNGLWYFSDKTEVTKVYEIESLSYGSKKGTINMLRTFASILSSFSVVYRNSKRIGGILDQSETNIVVTDSIYNFIPMKRRGIKVVSLNNADIVWHSYFYFKNRPNSIKFQFYGIEMFDFLIHKLMSDYVISPCLLSNLPKPGKNTIRVGPIVRNGLRPKNTSMPAKSAVVMLSGSVFGTPINFSNRAYPMKIDVVGRNEPKNWVGTNNINFHGRIRNTYDLLNKADLAVVNGGFSAVSEIFWLGLPMVVVPVPGHAEQWINAKTIERLGLGLIATTENYEDIMLEVFSRIQEFKLNYEKIEHQKDGAEQSALSITRLLTS